MTRFNFPLALVVIALSIGIVFGNYVDISEVYLWGLFGGSFLVLIFFWYCMRQDHRVPYGFGIAGIITMISFGMVLEYLHDPKHQKQQYTAQYEAPAANNEVAHTVQFYIQKRLTPTAYYERYYVQVMALDAQACFGKLLLRVPRDSISFVGSIGTVYTTVAALRTIAPPRTPGQFDYASYLKRQYIYHQLTVPETQLIAHPQPKRTLGYYAAHIRRFMYQRFADAGCTTRQLSIINALLLGQRQDIDPTVYAAYRDAGALHILAISGLHIGILLWILTTVLRPISRLGKWGKICSTVFILMVLWGFAVVSGLSVSVFRAVLLFSSMTVGIQLRSTASVYNGLVISAGIILCAQPMAVFAVGFQFSYIAVIGIVWMQPILYKRLRSRWYGVQYFWKLISVTIAAQLAVLPLTLLYFHQFPMLFLISNVVVLPWLGVILGLGLVCMVVAIWGSIPASWALVFGKSIDACTAVITWVADQEGAVLTTIFCTLPLALCGYGVLITAVQAFHKGGALQYRRLQVALVLYCGVLGYIRYKEYTTTALRVHQYYKTTLLSIQERGQLYAYSDAQDHTKSIQQLLQPYALSRGLQLKKIQPLQQAYCYGTQRVLVVGKSGVYPKGVQFDVVVLSQTPKLHLERLIDSVNPRYIIADGSAYHTAISHWKATCNQQGILFQDADIGSMHIKL